MPIDDAKSKPQIMEMERNISEFEYPMRRICYYTRCEKMCIALNKYDYIYIYTNIYLIGGATVEVKFIKYQKFDFKQERSTIRV